MGAGGTRYSDHIDARSVDPTSLAAPVILLSVKALEAAGPSALDAVPNSGATRLSAKLAGRRGVEMPIHKATRPDPLAGINGLHSTHSLAAVSASRRVIPLCLIISATRSSNGM
jgi:hypothetical protein